MFCRKMGNLNVRLHLFLLKHFLLSKCCIHVTIENQMEKRRSLKNDTGS